MMIILEKLKNYVYSFLYSDNKSLDSIRKKYLIIMPIAAVYLISIIMLLDSFSMSLMPFFITTAVFGGIIIMLFMNIAKQEKEFLEKLPYTIKKAKVIAKRSSLIGSVGNSFLSTYSNSYGEDCVGSQTFGINDNSYITKYYVTFEMNDGSRVELNVPDTEYGLLLEGDTGVLKYKLDRYNSFERDYTGEKC